MSPWQELPVFLNTEPLSNISWKSNNFMFSLVPSDSKKVNTHSKMTVNI